MINKKKVRECHAEFVFQVEIKRFIVGSDLIVCRFLIVNVKALEVRQPSIIIQPIPTS